MNTKPILLTLMASSAILHAQEADLAKKLANPISDLISLPIQSNYDFGVGPGDGTKWTTNIQPVIPFGIIGAVIGHEIPVVYGERRLGDPARLVADAGRARAELGWKPRYADLATIVAHAWRWERGREG